MKKVLAYEFRRILLPLCIFAAVAAALFAAAALSADFIDVWYEPIDEFGEIMMPHYRAGDP